MLPTQARLTPQVWWDIFLLGHKVGGTQQRAGARVY